VEATQAKPAAEDKTTREWLLQRLREVMEMAMQRVTNPKTPAPEADQMVTNRHHRRASMQRRLTGRGD